MCVELITIKGNMGTRTEPGISHSRYTYLRLERVSEVKGTKAKPGGTICSFGEKFVLQRNMRVLCSCELSAAQAVRETARYRVNIRKRGDTNSTVQAGVLLNLRAAPVLTSRTKVSRTG